MANLAHIKRKSGRESEIFAPFWLAGSGVVAPFWPARSAIFVSFWPARVPWPPRSFSLPFFYRGWAPAMAHNKKATQTRSESKHKTDFFFNKKNIFFGLKKNNWASPKMQFLSRKKCILFQRPSAALPGIKDSTPRYLHNPVHTAPCVPVYGNRVFFDPEPG